MNQGGGFTKNLTEKPTNAPIKNEASNGLKNVKYSIAMARTSDPNSATAQWFVNTADNTFLNWTPTNAGYAVFGKVISGFETVDKIEQAQTSTQNGMQNVPVDPIVITAAYRTTQK